jgi:hypothetical protein
MPWKNNTGEAGSAKGEDSVRGKLAIVKISLYDGNNNMPTVKDYTVPFISLTSAAIVSPGDLVLKSLPICEIALKIRPNRPALSFCAAVLVRSVGNVVIKVSDCQDQSL